MARTPKNIEVQDVNDESIDQAAVASAMDVMRDQAQEEQLELLELASDVGALRALEFTRNMVAAATIRLFQKVSDSKKIKDLPIRQPDGSVATATNLDEFCRLAFGKPRSAMFEASATLEALGEQAYEAASRLGLNRSSLRAARALPSEKLEVVRLAIEGGSTKAEVLSVIEDLAEKAQQAEAAAAEAKAELKASEEVLAAKNKTIDRLQRDLKRIEKLPPDEQLAGIKKEAIGLQSETIGLVRGGLRQALIKLNDAPDDASKVAFMAALVGAVYVELDALREEFGLSLAAVDTTPEWERWANAQGTNAGAGAGTAAN